MTWLKTVLQGLITGGCMSVPGVSGGTTAILLGCYKRLIEAAGRMWKKANFLFLVEFVGGALAGIGLAALVLNRLLDTFPIPVQFLFLGVVVAGLWQLLKDFRRPVRAVSVLFGVLGVGMVVGIELLPKGLLEGTSSLPVLFLFGIVLSIALILPGISTTHLLWVLGLYLPVMEGITKGNFALLAPLALGLVAGVLLLTRPLAFCMNKFPQQCDCLILGFVLASVWQLFPFEPIRGLWTAAPVSLGVQCALGAALAVAGFFLMRFVSKKIGGAQEEPK